MEGGPRGTLWKRQEEGERGREGEGRGMGSKKVAVCLVREREKTKKKTRPVFRLSLFCCQNCFFFLQPRWEK